MQILGRIITNSFYLYQEIRIGFMNQIRDLIRKKIEGIKFNEVEVKKEKKDFKQKYTDSKLLKKWRQLLVDGGLSEKEKEFQKKCSDLLKESRQLERKYKEAMLDYITGEKIYVHFLGKVRGIGVILSANLIKEFGNCDQYDTVSKLWAHTSNHVVDGKALKLRKGQKITYNPKLRTLTWKISDCLMKQNKGYYRQIYDTEKKKQLNREYEQGFLQHKYGKNKDGKWIYKESDLHLTKGHAHNRALRKTRKIFLDHYWHASRELAGLSAEKNYVEGVLLHNHIIPWRQAIEMESGNEG